MDIDVAYLARGNLYLKLHQAPARLINSEFGQSAQERVLQIQRRNIFRNRGPMANFLPPQMVQAMEEQENPAPPVQMTSVCCGATGQLFYALEVGSVAGLFRLDRDRIKEQRLFHGSDYKVQHLDIRSTHDEIACTTLYPSGAANIAIMPVDGSRPHDVTEGDSIDLAPRWIPGESKVLVFQSAGIGRDRGGYIVERSPFRIEKLDFDRREVITLAEDENYDFLAPKMAADGTLYYIRRPYKSLQTGFNPLHILRDLILMPFRLLYAIYQFLNFFTLRYTGKPLKAAGTPQSLDAKSMNAWGEKLDVEKAMRRNRSDSEAPSLVPNSWQLLRQRANGEVEVASEGVLYYDLGDDGTIVCTNGSAIDCIDAKGRKKRLAIDKLIEQVVLVTPSIPIG